MHRAVKQDRGCSVAGLLGRQAAATGDRDEPDIHRSDSITLSLLHANGHLLTARHTA
jgi:hypothetical protein